MQLFIPFYLVLCIITTCLYAKKSNNQQYSVQIKNYFSFALFIFFIFIVSSRSFTHPGDTKTYLSVFRYLQQFDLYSSEIDMRLEAGFLYLTQFIGKIYPNERFYLFSISIVESSLWYACFRVWLKKNDVLLATLIFISFFASYNLGANVLRQGIAMPIAFIGLKYLLNRRILLGVLTISIGMLFHKTVAVVLVAWLLTFKRVHILYYIFVWFILALLSVSGTFLSVVGFIQSDVNSYAHLVNQGTLDYYQTGFRLDFWLFSLIPLILFYLVKNDERGKYLDVMKYYLVVYSAFIIMFEVPYSDRFGLYTWLMIPIFCPLFIGDYKIKILNSYLFTAIAITFAGMLFFQFYPIMSIGVKINEVF